MYKYTIYDGNDRVQLHASPKNLYNIMQPLTVRTEHVQKPLIKRQKKK